MSKVLIPLAVAVGCSACAQPGTRVLEPYALADGKMFQDVVTIGADENGSAPVVTHVKTFELRTGYKGGARPTSPVASASGSGPGLTTTVAGAATSAGISAATSLGIAASGWNRTTISNNVDNSNSNSNSNANINTNTNSNSNSNNNANINQ